MKRDKKISWSITCYQLFLNGLLMIVSVFLLVSFHTFSQFSSIVWSCCQWGSSEVQFVPILSFHITSVYLVIKYVNVPDRVIFNSVFYHYIQSWVWSVLLNIQRFRDFGLPGCADLSKSWMRTVIRCLLITLSMFIDMVINVSTSGKELQKLQQNGRLQQSTIERPVQSHIIQLPCIIQLVIERGMFYLLKIETCQKPSEKLSSLIVSRLGSSFA